MDDNFKNDKLPQKKNTYIDLIIKIDPIGSVKLTQLSFGDWNFFYNSQKMLSSKELDLISDKFKTIRLPNMFYGYNLLYIVNFKKNFLYEINPLKMINLCNFQERNSLLFDSKENNDIKLNSIYYVPKELKVQYYNKWKYIKFDNRDDVKTMTPTFDWSFSSTYMGNISSLNKHNLFKENNKILSYHFKNIEQNKNEFDIEFSDFRIEQSDQDLPLNRLGRDNPILDYIELNLYDDELEDNGLAQGNLRFRIMKDCFFGLLRNYLRVDNVICRIIDTRIFHSFGDNYILRDFQVKENTFEEIKSKGFVFTSDFCLSHNQSDSISKSLDIVFEFKDKIILYD